MARFVLAFFAYVLVEGSDMDASLDQVGLIERWGYPVEKYDVITHDGYILDLVRIPRGRSGTRNITRPAILLVHGLLASGAQWILNLPEQSPGFIFADEGLDVFIANMRGTTYGRRHRTLDPDRDHAFWKFSFDEMARYDLPAIVDEVLAVSGQDQIYYMGDSQGTLVSFLFLADRPRYNRKIKSLFLLSPIATGHYIRGILQFFISLYSTFWPVTEAWRFLAGSFEAFSKSQLLVSVVTMLCSLPMKEGCYDAFYLLAGPPDFNHLNTSRIEVYISNFPAGTSSRNMLHWLQLTSSEKVTRFDYNNPIDNMFHYGQVHPPVYNYSEIEVPMYFYWSRNDWLTTPLDIQKDLIPKLRRGLVRGAFEVPEYNHLDFVASTTAAERIYRPVLMLIKGDIDREHALQSPQK